MPINSSQEPIITDKKAQKLIKHIKQGRPRKFAKLFTSLQKRAERKSIPLNIDTKFKVRESLIRNINIKTSVILNHKSLVRVVREYANGEYDDYKTLLSIATEKQEHDIVLQLIKAGANANIATKVHSITHLESAIIDCDERLISFLFLAQGIDASVVANNNWNPLVTAILSLLSDPIIFRLIKSKGTDVNKPIYDTGLMILYVAISNSSINVVKALLSAGAIFDMPMADDNPYLSIKAGWTPLIYALHKRKFGAARLLLAFGASLNCRACPEFPSTLFFSASTYSVALTMTFLMAGVDTSLKREDGKTASMLAQENDRVDIALLIDYWERFIVEHSSHVLGVTSLKLQCLRVIEMNNITTSENLFSAVVDSVKNTEVHRLNAFTIFLEAEQHSVTHDKEFLGSLIKELNAYPKEYLPRAHLFPNLSLYKTDTSTTDASSSKASPEASSSTPSESASYVSPGAHPMTMFQAAGAAASSSTPSTSAAPNNSGPSSSQ